jgi:succinate-semialdehyde dehydrogenase/glutarate-semialdehyde dehydrogenase
MTLIAVNPADGTELARYQNTAPEQVRQAIDRAQSAFLAWRARPIAERSQLLRSLASTLRENSADLAMQATLEMGKILREAEAEVEKAALFCEYYADNAERFLAPRTIEGAGVENYVRH